MLESTKEEVSAEVLTREEKGVYTYGGGGEKKEPV